MLGDTFAVGTTAGLIFGVGAQGEGEESVRAVWCRLQHLQQEGV